MTITLGDIKKICKEKGIAFRAGSLFGVSKNDSGKCDCFIDTADKSYAVKIISVGADARYVYFNNIGGGYISVKGVHGTEDFMWVKPDFDKKQEDAEAIILLDSDVSAIEVSKNAAVTVTSGAAAFGCKVYTPSAFLKLL